jgi:hypothetical protein
VRLCALALLVLIAGCRTVVAPAELTTRNLGGLSDDSGVVSAKVIDDPDPPDIQLGPGEEFRAAALLQGDAPEYPPHLVDRRLPPHVVALRIVFDESGRLIETTKSPLAPSTESEHARDFEAAATGAVGTWRCYPARIRKFRDAEDSDADGKPDYRILVDEKVLKTRFDLAFSFEIVNGQPVVKRTH